MFGPINRRIGRVLLASILPLSMSLTMAGNTLADSSPFEQPTQQPAPDSQRLTIDAVGQILQSFGLNPEKVDNGYIVKATDKDGMTFEVYVSLCQTQEYIWLSSNLIDINQANQQELLNMLVANEKYGVATFCSTGKYVALQMSIPNSGITVDEFRNELKAYFATLEDSKPLWNAPAVAPAPAPAPAPSQPLNPFGS